ncbi:MAG: glycosyltransferase [Bdellovibrionales bacterium]|nr:glycosyltransferase [Bdellovibrionales bacterium]
MTPPNSSKRRIAWFSPTLRSSDDVGSVARYATELLLTKLSGSFEIELFENGFVEDGPVPSSHYLQAFHRHEQNPFDVFFYQLEDRPSSYFTRIHLGLIPGVVWFHDFLLSTDGPEPILNSSWNDTSLHFRGKRSSFPERGKEYTRVGPHARREAAFSLCALFSSIRDHHEYLELRQDGITNERESFYLPVPVEPISLKSCPLSNELVLGMVCPPHGEYRVHKVLQALRALPEDRIRLLWFVDASHLSQAHSLVREYGVRPERVDIRDGRSPEAWRAALGSIDVCIHTFFSSYGHLEPYISLSLMAGKPVLSSSFGATGFLPEEVAFLVDPGETEAHEIAALLKRFVGCELPKDNCPGQMLAQENFLVDMVAGELAQVFERTAGQISHRMLANWSEFLKRARAELARETSALFGEGWDTVCRPTFQEMGWLQNAGGSR